MDVETFWKSLQPEQRRELLKVPLTSLLQGVCSCVYMCTFVCACVCVRLYVRACVCMCA